MIKAKIIMTENVITINENASMLEAAKLMVSKHVDSLLVTKNNMPTAIIVKNDLINGLINKNPSRIKVKDIMSKNFFIINPKTSYPYLLKKLRKEHITKFPVVENNKLVGIIT